MAHYALARLPRHCLSSPWDRTSLWCSQLSGEFELPSAMFTFERSEEVRAAHLLRFSRASGLGLEGHRQKSRLELQTEAQMRSDNEKMIRALRNAYSSK